MFTSLVLGGFPLPSRKDLSTHQYNSDELCTLQGKQTDRRSLDTYCCSLNANIPHSLVHSNTWFPSWWCSLGSLGGMVLLENILEVSFESVMTPAILISLCFLFAGRCEPSTLSSSHSVYHQACCSPTMMMMDPCTSRTASPKSVSL